MVKFYAFILSCLSFVFLAAPAHAGRLLFWRFEGNQNRLVFTTDQGVQPTAQLIADPTRLVIDLPGTVLGRPTINENYRGVITGIRIGQFDTSTTRIVIELAPGYILDPKQIKIKGISPTQWTVNLPKPQRGSFQSSLKNNPINNKSNQVANANSNNLDRRLASNSSLSGSDGVKVTSSGLVVEMNGSFKNKIKVQRSKDRRQINVRIQDLKAPQNLLKSWAVNQYGVSDVKVVQTNSSTTTLTLNVNPDSPDWQATFMRTGGLLLWPPGGVNRVADLSNPSVSRTNTTTTSSVPINVPQSTPIRVISPINSSRNNNNNNQLTTLNSLSVNYNQLIIQSSQSVRARANWTNGNRVYQIRLDNTKVSRNFRLPQLSANSPIARLRIDEPDARTVIISVEPARNTEIRRLNQLRENLWTLSLNKKSIARRPQRITSIPVNPTFSRDPNNFTPMSRPIPVGRPNPATNNTRPARKSRAVVVIDAGHGGKDPGAIGIGGVQEKRVVMTISKEVERLLEQQGIQVRMTRANDTFVSLQGRTAMANRINATLFVSIHANSAGRNKPHVNGYETYYFQSGRNLASVIHRNVLRRVNVKDRKVRQARFYVLRKSRMPSVLIETGFLTGRDDAVKLQNSWFQKQMAKAIAAGIVEYIQANRL